MDEVVGAVKYMGRGHKQGSSLQATWSWDKLAASQTIESQPLDGLWNQVLEP